ncbi:glycosyltransferase [Aquiflexum sp. TKW24L]|uniref:glycosyltransferase n=1 Tax=Aquiflexum sp. TKW24L TaxID=2942212 RepID=UPI0020BFCF07|nr:glycosyltransferase [Aquiflexum sp. TKW24L]MCL6260783.1 glycosyltransferase [Aquiflexum sp. TKW24L]
MGNIDKVFIEPSSKVLFSTFYIQGIIDEFGKQHVSFSNKYFKELDRTKGAFNCYLALVVVSPNKISKRIIIDFQDKSVVVEEAYKWADIYAKININDKLVKSDLEKKMVSIPPGFGIKLWDKPNAIYHSLTNFIKSRSATHLSWKRFFLNYRSQNLRGSLNDYLTPKHENEISDTKPYIFLIGRLWNSFNSIEQTNLMRKKFIEACLNGDYNFEGGFLAKKHHPEYEEYKHLCFLKPYSTIEYINKTKASAIVFNTPTVHNCHGWKLGEFLAMGKAIISMPLSNILPEDLVHGKNIHFISSIDEVESAVHHLLEDPEYRAKLEKGAKEYYEKFVAPNKVIQRIFHSLTGEA